MNYSYVWSELRHRSQRTLVNILGIAVGIALFLSINAVSAGYRKAVSQPFEDLGADLVIQREEKNRPPSGETTRSMRGIRLPFSNQLLAPEDLAELNRLDGVSAAAGSLLLWEFTPGGFQTILGVDLGQPDLGPVKVKQWLQQGRFPAQPGEALLEKHFAKFRGIRVGESLGLGERSFTVVGLLEIREGAQVTAANVYLQLRDAQSLLKGSPEAINLVYLRLRDPALQGKVRQEILAAFKGMSASSSDSFLELMGGVSLVSGRFALLVSFIALVASVLLIVKSMSASLIERSSEIGVLKAVGWTEKDVQQQLLGEALIQCLLGGLLGVALGYLGALLIGSLPISLPTPWELNPVPAAAKLGESVSQTIRLPVALSWELAGIALGLSLAAGGLTSCVLGKMSSRMKPASILRRL